MESTQKKLLLFEAQQSFCLQPAATTPMPCCYSSCCCFSCCLPEQLCMRMRECLAAVLCTRPEAHATEFWLALYPKLAAWVKEKVRNILKGWMPAPATFQMHRVVHHRQISRAASFSSHLQAT